MTGRKGRQPSAARERAVLATGASRGITGDRDGLAAGDRVAIHHRGSPGPAERLRAEPPGTGHVAVRADLADPAPARRMAEEAAAALGGIDELASNARVFVRLPITRTTYEERQAAWRETLAVTEWAGGTILGLNGASPLRSQPVGPYFARILSSLLTTGRQLGGSV